jgi:alpha-tubulin suppressor-like RCC1 family protein
VVLGLERSRTARRQHDERQQRPGRNRGRSVAMRASPWVGTYTCGLDFDGHAFLLGRLTPLASWADGANNTDRRIPAPVTGGLSFTSIAAGAAHACGITVQGDAYCWGRNTGGQLGDGSTADHSTPGRVKGSAQFCVDYRRRRSYVRGQLRGRCILLGRNTYGQLGDGGTTDQTTPVRVTGAHAFSSVRAFGSHTCGATLSGEAFCWDTTWMVNSAMGHALIARGQYTSNRHPVAADRQQEARGRT